MWALPGQRRPTRHIFRVPLAIRCAVGLLSVAGGLAFLLPASFGAAAEEAPISDTPKFPPWFKEFTSAVITNSQRAREQAEAKLAEARRTGDRVTETYAELAVATAFRRQNNLPTALEHTRAALSLVDTLPDDLLRFNAYYIHSLNLSAFGDYASAVEYLLRSLSYADARNSTRARSTAVAALGSAYEHLGDLPKALEFKRESLTLAEQLGDQRTIGMYAGNLASLQDTLGDRASARRNYERALAIVRASGNRTETADI
jgi:tetratricopeptide (TPR) repeat protein